MVFILSKIKCFFRLLQSAALQPSRQGTRYLPTPGKFLNFEEQPKDPAALQNVLRGEKHSRERLKSGDIKEHIETLSGKGKEKKSSLRAQLAQDKKTVNAAPKENKTVQRTVAKTKNKGLEV